MEGRSRTLVTWGVAFTIVVPLVSMGAIVFLAIPLDWGTTAIVLLTIAFFIGIFVGPGLITSGVADFKCRNWVGWLIFGLLLSIIALVAVLVVSDECEES